MDFDLELLLWLLIPLFGLLGKRRKKKQPVKTAPSKTETVVVENNGKTSPTDDPFEEALRQIKKALGQPDQPEPEAEKAKVEPTVLSEPEPVEVELRSEFHEHAFRETMMDKEPAVSAEDRFESLGAGKGDRFRNLERRKDDLSPERALMEQPVLTARRRKAKKIVDDVKPAEGDTERTKDLQRAFVWREILGPPRSRSRRIR